MLWPDIAPASFRGLKPSGELGSSDVADCGLSPVSALCCAGKDGFEVFGLRSARLTEAVWIAKRSWDSVAGRIAL
jgi:hypothetical protein